MTIFNQEIIASIDKDLIPSLNPSGFTYSQIKDLREEAIWKNIDMVSVEQALQAWYKSMNRLTAINYQSGM